VLPKQIEALIPKTIDFLRCVYNDLHRTLSELNRRIDNMYTMVQNRNALWHTDETSSAFAPNSVELSNTVKNGKGGVSRIQNCMIGLHANLRVGLRMPSIHGYRDLSIRHEGMWKMQS
jgi:hypothetical protein